SGTWQARSLKKPWRSDMFDPPCIRDDRTPSHSMNLIAAIESRLGSGWSIAGELGTGATSRVYLATRGDAGPRLVVKVMKSGGAAAARSQYFLLEMQVLQKMSHPNVVPMSGAG